jgi:pimeloyl-ACP methyl ester carboxylesterase
MEPTGLIQVRSYGNSGSYVVLLHGGPGAPGDIAPLASYLQNRFRVLEPLQRISGGIPLTVAGHVADLYDVLRDPVQESGSVANLGGQL